MRARVLERLVWTTTACVAVVATLMIRRQGAAAAVQPASESTQAPAGASTIDSDSLYVAANAVMLHDPFRFTHRPAAQEYTPGMESVATVVQKAPRPILALQGIAGRAERWEAILTGVPGREGSVVVRSGDTLGGLRITHVGRDTVVVRSADTAWRLVMKGTLP